jgi:superfamily II DNA/RNA helicase
MSFDLQPVQGDQNLPQQDTAAPAAPANGFEALGLAPEILKSVAQAGYTDPTDVQMLAIPAAIAGGDLLVSSRTGSGKTAAFVLPALQRVIAARNDPAKKRERGQPSGPRVLVLAPTRELAMQVSKACMTYGRNVQGLRVATVVGGVPYAAQLKALRGPLDILIATPGRLLDHMGTGKAVLGQVEMLVLDEADRMLDMGFIDDIHAIAQVVSRHRQTMMFSATFEGSVGNLARELTNEPQRIRVSAPTEAHSQIEQRLHWADDRAHRDALLEHLLTERDMDQAVVFTSTQRDADELAMRLADIGHSVAALHGGMPQGRRNRVLGALRMRNLRVLVATDVAARGIDVPTITHVINYGLPMKAEDYVHRIGRTGRAGRSGLAITLAERRDVGMIRRIERFTTHAIPPAVVAGLEPRLAPPAPSRPRPNGAFRDERPGPRGHGHGHGAPRGRFDDRSGGGRFGDRPAGRFDNRFDDRSGAGFGDRPAGRFGDRANTRFEPRGPGADRGPAGADARAPFHGPAGRAPYGGERPRHEAPRADARFRPAEHAEGGERPASAKPARAAWGGAPRGDAPRSYGKPRPAAAGDRRGPRSR